MPILFFCIALALGVDTGGSSVAFAIKLVFQEVGIGLVVGLGMAATLQQRQTAQLTWLHTTRCVRKAGGLK